MVVLATKKPNIWQVIGYKLHSDTIGPLFNDFLNCELTYAASCIYSRLLMYFSSSSHLYDVQRDKVRTKKIYLKPWYAFNFLKIRRLQHNCTDQRCTTFDCLIYVVRQPYSLIGVLIINMRHIRPYLVLVLLEQGLSFTRMIIWLIVVSKIPLTRDSLAILPKEMRP